MKLLNNAAEIWTAVLEKNGRAWWVEIVTQIPKCTYYFGPFPSSRAAQLAQSGYIEDLEQEAAQGIAVKLKRCQPQKLTFFADELVENVDQ